MQSCNDVTFSRTRDFPVLDTQRYTPNRKCMPQYSPHAAMLWESRVDAQYCKTKNYSDISEKDKAHFWVILNLFSQRPVYLSLVFSFQLCMFWTLVPLTSPCTGRNEAQACSLHGIIQQTAAACFGCMSALKSERGTWRKSQAAHTIVPV